MVNGDKLFNFVVENICLLSHTIILNAEYSTFDMSNITK